MENKNIIILGIAGLAGLGLYLYSKGYFSGTPQKTSVNDSGGGAGGGDNNNPPNTTNDNPVITNPRGVYNDNPPTNNVVTMNNISQAKDWLKVPIPGTEITYGIYSPSIGVYINPSGQGYSTAYPQEQAIQSQTPQNNAFTTLANNILQSNKSSSQTINKPVVSLQAISNEVRGINNLQSIAPSTSSPIIKPTTTQTVQKLKSYAVTPTSTFRVAT